LVTLAWSLGLRPQWSCCSQLWSPPTRSTLQASSCSAHGTTAQHEAVTYATCFGCSCSCSCCSTMNQPVLRSSTTGCKGATPHTHYACTDTQVAITLAHRAQPSPALKRCMHTSCYNTHQRIPRGPPEARHQGQIIGHKTQAYCAKTLHTPHHPHAAPHPPSPSSPLQSVLASSC
jgi:hypothetical protein